MDDTINKLYRLILKIVTILEDKFAEVKLYNSEITVIDQKHIASILTKLATLIIQLNKLNKEDIINSGPASRAALLSEDNKIIDRFLKQSNKTII